MTVNKRKFAGVVLVSCLITSFSPFPASCEDTGLDMMAIYAKKHTVTQNDSAKASYSKDYETWSKAYLMGDMKHSDEALAKVLVSMKNCSSLLLLQRRAVSRLLFADIPKGSKLKEVQLKVVFAQWLRVAKKTLGENHRFVGDAYSSCANFSESRNQFSQAAEQRMNQYRVYRRAHGEKSFRTLRALYLSANDMYKAKKYKEMEPTVKKVIKLSEQANFKTGLRNSVQLYISLLKTTKRQKQAQIIAKKYGV